MIFMFFLLLCILLRGINGLTYNYNADESELTIQFIDPESDMFFFVIEIKSKCEIFAMVFKNSINNPTTYEGSNKCASMSLLSGSISTNMVTITFNQLNFKVDQYYDVSILDFNNKIKDSGKILTPSIPPQKVGNLTVSHHPNFPNPKAVYVSFTNSEIRNNSQIVQYRIAFTILSTSNCQLVVILNCNNTCGTPNTVGSKGSKSCSGFSPEVSLGLFDKSKSFFPLEIVGDYFTSSVNYSMSIQECNRWGCGNSTLGFLFIPVSMAHQPVFTKFTSTFPITTVDIYFQTPLNFAKDISQIIVVASTNNSSRCIVWTIDCASCRNNANIGSNGNKITLCDQPTHITYTRTNFEAEMFVESTDNSFFRPGTEYFVQGQANNNWGWGEVGNLTFVTNEYIPNIPLVNNAFVFFPQYSMTLDLSQSISPNGNVFLYNMEITSSDSSLGCVIIRLMCAPCRKDSPIRDNGVSLPGCKIYKIINENLSNFQKISVTFTDSVFVKPSTSYQIFCQAQNGWGRGQINSYSFQSQAFGQLAISFVFFRNPASKMSMNLKVIFLCFVLCASCLLNFIESKPYRYGDLENYIAKKYLDKRFTAVNSYDDWDMRKKRFLN